MTERQVELAQINLDNDKDPNIQFAISPKYRRKLKRIVKNAK